MNGGEAYDSSGGNSKFTRSPRNPRVFHAPTAIPTTIQIPPTIQAFQLRFFHRKKQIVNPASGGVQIAMTARPTAAAISRGQWDPGIRTSPITRAVKMRGGSAW